MLFPSLNKLSWKEAIDTSPAMERMLFIKLPPSRVTQDGMAEKAWPWGQTHLPLSYSSYVNLDQILTSLGLSVFIYNIMLMALIVMIRVHCRLNRKGINWKNVGEIHRLYGKAVKPGLWVGRNQGCQGVCVQEAGMLYNLLRFHCYNECYPLLSPPVLNYSVKFQGSWEEGPIGPT